MGYEFSEEYIGNNFSDEVKNLVRLTLAFTEAVGAHQDDPVGNLVVSPYNALMALSMVAKASGGDTRKELAEVLFGDPDADIDLEAGKFMALNKKILDANKGSVTLATANGFWVNQDQADVTLNKSYAAEIKGVYDAEVSAESFSNAATADKINKWARDNTNGLIPEITDADGLTADQFMLLASSLYFKGDWTSAFDKGLTEDKEFTADDGQKLLTAMMAQDFKKDLITYQDADDYEAVTLTYGEKDPRSGNRPTMRLVLIRPKDDGVSAHDWLTSQDESVIPAWVEPAAFENVIGTVELPHLEMKEKYDLIDPLNDMGIEQAFDERAADFSLMTEEQKALYISKVQHDVAFKTDEKGSEAAAITQVGVSRSLSVLVEPKRINLEFNRSFVLMMQDVETGAPLFMGAVNRPNEDMKKRCGGKPAQPS